MKKYLLALLTLLTLTGCSHVVVWSVSDFLWGSLIGTILFLAIGLYLVYRVRKWWRRLKAKYFSKPA